MARIFLSHSSADELDAVAVRDWLAENGWGKDDIFLDLDPTHGLTAGERWQQALRQAADRCEAVVFIISPDWAKSKWCLTEFLLAHNLNKRIFGVVVKTVVIAELPVELTAEWQLGYLVGDGPLTDFEFTHKEQTHRVHWLTHGLNSLRNGLAKAGIGANHFNWPPLNQPDRAPYRGLEPLDEIDAAIYFGRDTQILQGLDILRGMRNGDGRTLFVILGPSGSGKSSFLRAGLLPRLKRDDRHFFILDIIRPSSHVISGDNGLANSLYKAWSEVDLAGKTLGDIKAALIQNPAELLQLLTSIQMAAAQRVQLTNEKSPPPTLILAIDQAEELFQADAKESELFLTMLGHCLAQNNYPYPLLILAFTIRSDRYEPLQTAAALTEYKSALFDGLKPLPPHCYKEVILGPAQQASNAGNKLEINPDLVDRLLEDFGKGGDPLPMLSLTLALLFKDYGGDGDLRLDEYEKLGGMEKVVNNIFESILSADVQQRKEQLSQLRNAFIPHLASINIQNNQIMRRQAFYHELPAASYSLINALQEKRLLVTDQQSGGKTIEVAHEAVLRQWGDLQLWLEEERENLKLVQSLEQAANDWAIKKDAAWLWHGVRLKAAEDLKQFGNYDNVLKQCEAFLNESRKLEITELERKEKQLQKIRRGTQMLVVAIVFLLMLGVWGIHSYDQSQERFRNAISLSLLSSFKNHPLKDGWLMLLAANKIHHSAKAQGALLDEIQANKRILKIITTGRSRDTFVFSADGARFLEGNGKTLRFWDAKTGQPIGEAFRLSGYEGEIERLALNPNGTRILSVSKDNTLRLWNAKTGASIGEPLVGNKQKVTSLAFSPDGSRILSGSLDSSLRLWDAKTGQPIGEPLKDGISWLAGVTSVAFSPDGTRIISGHWDKTVRLWNAETGQLIGEPLRGHKDMVYSVAFSPDGTHIISVDREGIMRLWDANTGTLIGQPLKGTEASVRSVAFSPDGTLILSGGGGILERWDVSTGRLIDVLNIHRDFASNWVFSADGTRALSSSDDRTLNLLDIRESLFIDPPLMKYEDPVLSVAFSPDGTRILSGNSDKTLRLLDPNTGLPIGEPLRGHEDDVSSVAFSPDGTLILSGSFDKTLRLWNAKTGEPIGKPLNGHEQSVTSVAFSPDGTRILSGSLDDTLRFWDTKTGHSTVEPINELSLSSVIFSPSGTQILSGGKYGMCLMDVKTGKKIWTVKNKDMHQHLAFSPDGTRILSGGNDKTLRLWEAETGQPIGSPLSGHEGPVRSVTFSPDGALILSGSFDETLRLWDAQTGEPIGEPLKGHQRTVTSVAFSPDGTRILSGSYNGTIRIWPAPPAWPAELCKKLSHNMSHKEWREWVSPDIDYIEQCPGLPIPPDAPDAPEKTGVEP